MVYEVTFLSRTYVNATKSRWERYKNDPVYLTTAKVSKVKQALTSLTDPEFHVDPKSNTQGAYRVTCAYAVPLQYYYTPVHQHCVVPEKKEGLPITTVCVLYLVP